MRVVLLEAHQESKEEERALRFFDWLKRLMTFMKTEEAYRKWVIGQSIEEHSRHELEFLLSFKHAFHFHLRTTIPLGVFLDMTSNFINA